MTVKSALSGVGNFALDVAASINNGPIHTRMREIDLEIAQLQEERARLEKQII